MSEQFEFKGMMKLPMWTRARYLKRMEEREKKIEDIVSTTSFYVECVKDAPKVLKGDEAIDASLKELTEKLREDILFIINGNNKTWTK